VSDGELSGRTVFMSGGSRGIGLAIAEKLAGHGANVALLAKTDQPHPKLEGTVHTAADQIRAAGGDALPIVGDVRDENAVEAAVAQTVDRFGGIDVVVNNASAITLAPIGDLEVKRFDLMMQINVRGTFVVTRACVPHLRESDHAHVLTLSPPVDQVPKWVGNHGAYTVSKMGMSILTLGLAADEPSISANCLWPRTMIATAAVQNLLGGDEAMSKSRTPAIVADAAWEIIRRPPGEVTGQALIDDEVLREAGKTDLSEYSRPDADLAVDIFVDGWGD
jgi:citronellol/citronellal dehydrogenase